MPVIIPPGYAQVTFEFSGPLIPDGVGAIVFGSTVAATASETGPDWASAFVEEIWTPIGSQELVFDRVLTVTDVASFEGIVDEVGGASGNPCPPNVSALIKKSTTQRGRRAQGRMFPPGILYDEAVNVSGIIDPAVVTDRTSRFGAWLGAVTMEMVILQNSEGESPPLSPPPVVNSLICDARVSTQRKRLR